MKMFEFRFVGFGNSWLRVTASGRRSAWSWGGSYPYPHCPLTTQYGRDTTLPVCVSYTGVHHRWLVIFMATVVAHVLHRTLSIDCAYNIHMFLYYQRLLRLKTKKTLIHLIWMLSWRRQRRSVRERTNILCLTRSVSRGETRTRTHMTPTINTVHFMPVW